MPDQPATVTVPGVELVRTGTWAASTGVTTVTTEDLEAMVAAAADPEIDAAAVKIGHTGALSTLGDSEPALGWVSNLRVSDDGQVLLGDLVDVPAGLADIMPKAFKRRSVEIAWSVKTPSGGRYRAALSGLALLGVTAPAVKGLADIVDLYQTAATTRAAAGHLDAESMSAMAFFDDPTGPTAAELVVNQLRWAKEAAASLAALVGIDGLQGVFDALDAMAARGARLAAGGESRDLPAAGVHDGAHADAARSEVAMTKLDEAEIRKILNLPDDADEAAVMGKLSEVAEEATRQRAAAGHQDDPPGGDPPGGTDAGTATAATTAAATAAAAAGQAQPEVVTLSAGQHAELIAQAADGAEARRILRTQEIDGIVTTALSAGKFTVDEAPEYRTLLVEHFDRGKALIDKLAANKVPVTPLGGEHVTAAAGEDPFVAWESQVFGTATPERS